jgi:hypothetical protein
VTIEKKNLILGSVMNYRFDVIKPFLSTLRLTGYLGDIVLFHSNITTRTIKHLREMGVLPIPFDSSFPHLEPTLAKYLNRWANDERIGTLGFYCFRYLLAYCYLKEFVQKYQYIMLTDVRDVIFQKDPFNFPIGNKLCCFMEREGISLRQEPVDAWWMEQAFNRSTLERLGDNPIVCSGVTIAPPNLMTDYVERMIDLFMAAPGRGWEARPGMDQAMHNYLIYNGLLPEIALYANNTSPVFTVGLEDNISLNQSGFIVNKRGDIPNIVHQYDRHWQVAKGFYSFRIIYKHYLTTIWMHHVTIWSSRWVLFRAAFSKALSIHMPRTHRTLVRARMTLRKYRGDAPR